MSKKKKKAPLPTLSPGVHLIDSHCHLDMDSYDQDCEEVINRSLAAGIKTIMTIGIDLPSSQAAIALAEKYPSVYCSVGVHPHHVTETSEADYEQIISLASHKKVKAYGEIGLDYVKNYAPLDLQISHFEKQVQIAKTLNLPLIIHDREAHDDTMNILRRYAPFPAGGVMHCFSGDTKLANQVIDLGFYLSIPGVVTFNKAEVMQEVATIVPLDKLLVETDGPFLTPMPYRGKRNEPVNVLYTAAHIAMIKGIPIDELATATTINAENLFGLQG